MAKIFRKLHLLLAVLMLIKNNGAKAWVSSLNSNLRCRFNSNKVNIQSSTNCPVLPATNRRTIASTIFFSNRNSAEDSQQSDDDDVVERTSFDQAGQSLTEQEDKKRLDLMGDFDSLGYEDDSAERVRAAIRERTAGLGIQKSQATAEYIARKEQAARSGGPGSQDPNMFGGLDLSQISDTKLKQSKTTDWTEDMPSMLYDPEKELSKEEQEEADPLMTKSIIEQYTYEISQSKFPTPVEALRQVGIMIVVVVFATLMIYGWDNLLRQIYTSVGFVPSDEDLANYASRFDGLDLPDSWTDGLDTSRMQQLSDAVDASSSSTLSVPAVEGILPDL